MKSSGTCLVRRWWWRRHDDRSAVFRGGRGLCGLAAGDVEVRGCAVTARPERNALLGLRNALVMMVLAGGVLLLLAAGVTAMIVMVLGLTPAGGGV